MTRHIKTVLHTLMHADSNDWKKTLFAQWPTIIGALNNKISIEKITDNNVLILGVQNSCWLQEVYFLADTLQAKINQALGAYHIKQIRFKIKGVKKQKTQKVQKTVSQPVIHAMLTLAEQQALEKISDGALKDALRAFCVRCHTTRYLPTSSE
ncbi:MAG TPA: DciA family protein [Candidatus Bathyarchaeia archaeon]|nr:DciA family protein [Candidatus Bathyarchaeia archaeon]